MTNQATMYDSRLNACGSICRMVKPRKEKQMRIIMDNDKIVCTCEDGMVGETIAFLHARDKTVIDDINRTLSIPLEYMARTYTAVPTLEELKIKEE